VKLSLITVNYNGTEKTIRLLESLRQQTDQNFDIIVVDNASSGDDARQLSYYREHTFSAFTLIQNSQNLGYSGGNNIGIKQALQNGANYVFLINSDTWTDPTFIAQLRPKLSLVEGLGAIPVNEGARTAYYGKIQWLKPTLQHIYQEGSGQKAVGRSFYVNGAGLLINTKVFQKIDFLDERYFLYFEDADFSIRAYKAGVPIALLDDISIHHEVSSTTKSLGAPLLLHYHWRNAHLFNWKNGPLWVKIALPFWSIFTILKQSMKIILGMHRDQSKAILAGVFDFYLGRFGKIR